MSRHIPNRRARAVLLPGARFALAALCLVLLTSLIPASVPARAEKAAEPATPLGIRARDAGAVQVWMGDEPLDVPLLGLTPLEADDPLAWEAIVHIDAAVAGHLLGLESCGPVHAEASAARFVWVLDPDGTSRWLNGELVSLGLARVADEHLASCYFDVLLRLESTARLERRGIWASLPPDTVPFALRPLRSHDWRRPGFVSVVDGKLYDAHCVPMHSVGSNLPNLPFRGGLTETLEWMRARQMRWMRVFATAHGPHGMEWAPQNAAAAAARLQALVAKVEAFNLSRPPSESIHVLITLTNYYPPGVPGDRYAFDHPEWHEAPVLPAPWYRPGVQRYSFQPPHGFDRLTNLPNYEVYYKPWVREIVSTLSRSPAVLGWQLGNELKARGSPPNDIPPDIAYEWYLEFTADMVDTIREMDQNHLIFMGAQYLAELTDWDYRPLSSLDLGRRDIYDSLLQRAVRACERYCWNVWSLTSYDFNTYAIDDAMQMSRHGIAAMLTEYGFTRGTPEQMQARYGGDRPAAVRNGLDRPWVTIDGIPQTRHWGVAELMQKASLAGVAPWASPAPGPWAGYDADVSRGITSAPDEWALWMAWSDVAGRLETANRAAGPSARCLGVQLPAETPLLASVPRDSSSSTGLRDGTLASTTGDASFASTGRETASALAPTPSCAIRPRGGIGRLVELDPLLHDRLGCATAEERVEPFVEQLFEQGHMLWRPRTGQMLVTFFGEGRYLSHQDQVVAASADPPLLAPAGMVTPSSRFGRLWRDVPGLRDRLGWAVSPERSFDGATQDFAHGSMIWTGPTQRLIRAYYADGTTVYIPDPTAR